MVDGNQYFAGTFDGNDYTIYNYTALEVDDSSNYYGIFAYNIGTIENLNVTGEINLETTTYTWLYVGIVAYNERNSSLLY